MHRVRVLTNRISRAAPQGLLYGVAPALMILHSLTAPVFPWAGWAILIGIMGVVLLTLRSDPMTSDEIAVWERLLGKGKGRHRSG